MLKTFTKKIHLLILQSSQPGLNYLTLIFFVSFKSGILSKLSIHFPNHPPGSLIDSLLSLDPAQKRSISVIYNSIDSLNPDQTARLKQTWEH